MINSKADYLIQENIQLPSLPAVAIKILDAVKEEETALVKLAEIISVDPALSAKMLKVANSSLFALSNEVTSISRAIIVLGIDTVKNIALSFVLIKNMSSKDVTGFDIDCFWRRSISIAVSAELLSTHLNYTDDSMFLTALLQDLGLLAILSRDNQEDNIFLYQEGTDHKDVIQREREYFGFDHQKIGYSLFKSWNFPESISIPILHHHCPDMAPKRYRTETEILYFADRLANIYHQKDIAEAARLIHDDLIKVFNFKKNEVLQFLDGIAEKSREIVSIFDLDPGEIQPYSHLLQQANVELDKLCFSNTRTILELQDANDKLKKLVSLDDLTGLYNYRYFQDALNTELSRVSRYQSSLSLVLFDVDNFKSVNDRYGHLAGDIVLMSLASAIKRIVRNSDILARIGGDEFAVILPKTNIINAIKFAEKLRLCAEGIVASVKDQTIRITISSGVTSVIQKYTVPTKDQLLEAADQGLYRSKQNGRNQVTVLELKELPDYGIKGEM